MAAMSVTVCGCSGSFPGPGSACSCYLVRAGDTVVLLDLGSGSLANVQRHVELGDIDAVVLSHSHPDHWVDLLGLHVALEYGVGRDGLPVYGTKDTLDLAQAFHDDLAPWFDWTVTGDGDEIAVGPLRLRLSRTDHWVETLAVRVDEPATGRSIAYSADTGPSWSFERLGAGIDLALCEATFADPPEEGMLHLSAGQAGAMSEAAGVGRLVLTHLWPGSDPDQHRRIGSEAFGRAVDIAAIDERYEL